MGSVEELNHMLGLVMRHFNSIIAGLEDDPREISPCWSTMTYDGDEREYDDAESWAYGSVQGMRFCRKDWQPLLSTPKGQAWFLASCKRKWPVISAATVAVLRVPH